MNYETVAPYCMIWTAAVISIDYNVGWGKSSKMRQLQQSRVHVIMHRIRLIKIDERSPVLIKPLVKATHLPLYHSETIVLLDLFHTSYETWITAEWKINRRKICDKIRALLLLIISLSTIPFFHFYHYFLLWLLCLLFSNQWTVDFAERFHAAVQYTSEGIL